MKYQVVISDQAKEDLSSIYSYILNNLKSKINADAVFKRLYEAMQDLNFMPYRYHLYPKEPWLSRGIRFFSVGNYSIFYAVDEDSLTVTIIHVVCGGIQYEIPASEGGIDGLLNSGKIERR